jgi:CDP-diacylglycerol--glycerol-3-phosphate 3-phosphatidyltransferase
MKKKEIFTISNFLSFIRILLVVPIFCYLSQDDRLQALIYILIAVITDVLDGYFARKLNQITDLGKALDPLADKFCTIGGLIALSLYQGFPWWITSIVILKDILIMLGSIFLISRRHVVVSSNAPGKITVFLIAMTVIIYLLNVEFLFMPLVLCVSIMLIYSMISYFKVFYRYYHIKDEG